ncbi:deoxyribonuclease IV [Halalkalibacter akibai]|uniref:Endonuclease IV n=1 Tax=Halalkalibacter akibai (strain ATCC 43226 / DSM 21942 / CIP 109018 / JCM 9157 / 1139) TaxID=1236973 RepID=W4QT79_HALA3|nr:deoxyribonuclease IV [Halalkalibacter akibai]GAE34838.1 endonuclease IV [Halalkalibacter akibai JCM 9157]
MFFGSHVSIRNGYLQAAKTALDLGANAFQYFPKNPRSIGVKNFDLEDAKDCATFCSEHNIASVAHSPYPTKLIPDNKDLEQQIIYSLQNDLEIVEACGSIGVVVHFGTTTKTDPLEGYKKMIDVLNQVLTNWSGTAKILLENNAGAGSDMGITLEEMVQVRSLTDFPDQIGFCFDTCHAFASGIWTGENWSLLEKKAIELNYFNELKAVHFNNSKYSTGQRKDRHANLIDGHITPSQLQEVLSTSSLSEIPFILETPKDESTNIARKLCL